MATTPNRLFRTALLGAVRGVLLIVTGLVVGGEAALSFGTIGIILCVFGFVIGAAAGGRIGGGASSRSVFLGALAGSYRALLSSHSRPALRSSRSSAAA